jgi:hypothetical protein
VHSDAAERIPSQEVRTVTYDASGTTPQHRTHTTTTYNEFSQPVEVDDAVEVSDGVTLAVGADVVCTKISCAHEGDSAAARTLKGNHFRQFSS